MPLKWQMTGLKEGLSRGMTRSNLCFVWEMGYWQVRREAEKLVRRLTVILGWGGGSLELERRNGFEIYFEDRVNMLMNWIRGEKKDKYDW